MKEYFGSCVDNPFETSEKLGEVVENAIEIPKTLFLKRCDLSSDLRDNMRTYPNDYRFYANEGIYFFEWSCIEHFYQESVV